MCAGAGTGSYCFCQPSADGLSPLTWCQALCLAAPSGRIALAKTKIYCRVINDPHAGGFSDSCDKGTRVAYVTIRVNRAKREIP